MFKKTILTKIVITIMLLSIIVIIFCIYNIYENNKEYEISLKNIKDVQEEYIDGTINIQEIEDNDSNKNNENNNSLTVSDKEDNTSNDKSSNDYEIPNINIQKLKQRNADVIGWIYIPNTKINFPILQGKTNDTYLRKNIDKKYSIAGSIFMESMNNKYFYDSNTIIYGHNMRNGDMFHDLRYFLSESYLKKHNKIYIYLENYIIEYKAQSSKIINKNDKIYTPKNGNTLAQMELADIKDVSSKEYIDKLTEVYNNNQLVLSSCYSQHGNDRTIVIAKFNKIYHN